MFLVKMCQATHAHMHAPTEQRYLCRTMNSFTTNDQLQLQHLRQQVNEWDFNLRSRLSGEVCTKGQ